MQKRWTRNNVDLKQLSNRIEEFFVRKGFETKNEQSQDEYMISVFLSPSKRVNAHMHIHILGGSNDFLIETIANELTHRSMLLGFLTSLIGGGNLVLRSVRAEEVLRNLERDFWTQIEDIVALFVSSSNGP